MNIVSDEPQVSMFGKQNIGMFRRYAIRALVLPVVLTASSLCVPTPGRSCSARMELLSLRFWVPIIWYSAARPFGTGSSCRTQSGTRPVGLSKAIESAVPCSIVLRMFMAPGPPSFIMSSKASRLVVPFPKRYVTVSRIYWLIERVFQQHLKVPTIEYSKNIILTQFHTLYNTMCFRSICCTVARQCILLMTSICSALRERYIYIVARSVLSLRWLQYELMDQSIISFGRSRGTCIIIVLTILC